MVQYCYGSSFFQEIDTKQEETGETLIFHRKQRENADKSEGHGERQKEKRKRVIIC
jgi:hypothetical protein